MKIQYVIRVRKNHVYRTRIKLNFRNASRRAITNVSPKNAMTSCGNAPEVTVTGFACAEELNTNNAAMAMNRFLFILFLLIER